MKKFVLISSFIGITHLVWAQEIKVEIANIVSYVNGSRIKKNSVPKSGQRVEINEGGSLQVSVGRMGFVLKEGIYNLDSMIVQCKNSHEYKIDDSVYTFLKSKNLLKSQPILTCLNPYQYSNKAYSAEEQFVKAKSDTVTLNWSGYRNEFKGNYFVVFQTMFNDYLGILKTQDNKLVVDLKGFKEENILYRVISEDGFEYDYRLIKRIK
jgi:hypothetical protein